MKYVWYPFQKKKKKMAEVMFYWSKWWNPEIDQNGQNYDIFFVKFETTPWMVPHR